MKKKHTPPLSIHSTSANARGASPTLLAKPYTKRHKKKTTHISVSRLGGGSKGSRSASWRGYLCAQGISPSNKINLSPQPRTHVLHRLANTNGWDCHGEEWWPKAAGDGEGCAMLASEQTATTNARGASPTLLAKYPSSTSQNSTKKRRLTLL